MGYKNNNYKSAFKLYSRGIELAPDNLALRDIERALLIDPVHEKTVLRRAHCYEALDPGKSLMDLDLLLYISVPDKFIHNRRNTLFLQSLVPNKQPEEVEAAADSLQSVKIEDKEHSLEDISMSALMDLSLDDLRDLDKKVGLYDCQQQTR